jgi:hypothetical protein
MGGPQASDDLELGAETQVWLAVSAERDALVSGKYLYHRQIRSAHPAASDVNFQNQVLDACARLTGVELLGGRTLNSELRRSEAECLIHQDRGD